MPKLRCFVASRRVESKLVLRVHGDEIRPLRHNTDAHCVATPSEDALGECSVSTSWVAAASGT